MLIIFDCDGVLIDSEIIYCSIDSEALKRLGHNIPPVEIAKRFTGLQSREMWETLSAELGFTIPETWVEDLASEYARRLEGALSCIPDVPLLVEKAHQLGHTICVASSTSLSALKKNLGTVGIHNLFNPHIFSVSQVKRGKPAPDVFLFAASQMGADPSECLVIEDSAAGVTAARRAGMTALGFIGGSHADAELATRLLSAGARDVFESMQQLSIWLEQVPGSGTA